MEFRIWAELIQQSRGALHIFLPVLDRGLDAIVHRLTDGKYIPIQVKCRGALAGRKFQLIIPSSELVEDSGLIIAGLLGEEQLGDQLIVVDEATFKQLASHDVVHGKEVFWCEVNLAKPPEKWKAHVIARENLGGRLMESAAPTEAPPTPAPPPIDRYEMWLGSVGETEVVRLLAENPDLDIFRPFPDLEMIEILVRHRTTSRFCGIQVKTAVAAAQRNGEASLHIRKATFVASPEILVVGLAWLADKKEVADECVLVPTDRLLDIASWDSRSWILTFRPHSPERTRLDPYRSPTAELGARVGAIVG